MQIGTQTESKTLTLHMEDSSSIDFKQVIGRVLTSGVSRVYDCSQYASLKTVHRPGENVEICLACSLSFKAFTA